MAKQIKPVPLKDKYWRDVQKKIERLFLDMVYRKLFAAIKTQEELYNAKSTLHDAIIKGRVGYSNGRFFGKFNSTLTKELRSIGAVYSGKDKVWKLISMRPVWD